MSNFICLPLRNAMDNFRIKKKEEWFKNKKSPNFAWKTLKTKSNCYCPKFWKSCFPFLCQPKKEKPNFPFFATKYLDILYMWWNILEFNLFLWCPVCPSRGNHNTQRKEILMSNDSYKPIFYNGFCKNFMGCCPKMAAKGHHFCNVGIGLFLSI